MATLNSAMASAVFDTNAEAQRAVDELRSAGISNDAISIVARHDGDTHTTDGAGEEVAKDVVGKAALGSGIGALLGVAALAIPGVGPFVAAGAISSLAVGGAAVTGTAIGAAAGGLAGALEDHGVGEANAAYYDDHVNKGGVFVSVDTGIGGVSADRANEILYQAGGHSANRARAL